MNEKFIFKLFSHKFDITLNSYAIHPELIRKSFSENEAKQYTKKAK